MGGPVARGGYLNDFAAALTRWLIRAVLVVAALVLFLGMLAVALALALVWALKALWAKLRGKTISPWVMPIDPRAGWRSVYRSRTGETVAEDATPHRPPPSTNPDAPRLPRRPLPGTEEITDVQPHAPSPPP